MMFMMEGSRCKKEQSSSTGSYVSAVNVQFDVAVHESEAYIEQFPTKKSVYCAG